MICEICGGKNVSEKRGNHDFVESGLTNVKLVNVAVRRCPDCDDVGVIIPRLPELHRLIAEWLTRKPTTLAAEEFRFLRKHLGYSSTDFAKKIGVTLETVSRWESGKHPLDPPAERLLRVLVATSKPVDRYPEDIFPDLEPGKRASKPARMRVVAPRKASGSWALTT